MQASCHEPTFDVASVRLLSVVLFPDDGLLVTALAMAYYARQQV